MRRSYPGGGILGAAVDFLERLSERDRERFVGAASVVRLARGEYLMRRGERGGDVYRVSEGELEIIDNRQQPAVVLNVVGKGEMVGEMGFLEDLVRTADVRAAEATVCQRWDRGSLLRVLDADPVFGATFYKALAGFAVHRARSITTTAMTGTLGAARAGSESTFARARELATWARTEMGKVEPLIRRDRAAARESLGVLLRSLMRELQSRFGRVSAVDQEAAGSLVAEELLPYVMRSHLGELANARVEGWCADFWTIGHISSRKPTGDGPLGEMIDEWALDLPTARGMRERRALAGSLVTECLPSVPPLRLLALGVNSASLLAPHLGTLGRMGGELVCLDPAEEARSLLDSDLASRPRGLRLSHQLEDLAQVFAGRSRFRHVDKHVVVADCLLEYLPETAAVAMLRACAAMLAPGGYVVVTAAAPAEDDLLFRYLLKWPVIRRSKAALTGLLESAGFGEVRAYEAGSAGLAAVGRRP